MDGDSVDIGVIHKPNDLVREKFSIVLGGEVRLSGLRGVELQTLADPLSEHVQGGVGLHDLRHRLLNQRLCSREPVSIGAEPRNRETISELKDQKSSPAFYLQSLQ